MTNHLHKKIFPLLVFLSISYLGFGQQRFLNNQRNWNDLMFNPAKIMEVHGKTIYTIHRQQYLGLGGNSPYITIIGGKVNLPVHYSLNMLKSESKKKRNYNYGLGGYYIHSNTGGVFDQNEICGQFGLQIKLNVNKEAPEEFNQLNFGVSVKGINNRYRSNGISLYDDFDPVFNSLQATNKFAVSFTPGFQFISRKVNLDAFVTLGAIDQRFASFTIMGNPQLSNFMGDFGFRMNYFGDKYAQLSLNKIHVFSSVFQQSWALNFGVNVFAGAKISSSSTWISNPGFYLGVIYKTSGKPRKFDKKYKIPMKYNSFSGSLNLFDANLNTLAMGPSTEIGIQYSRNTKLCECDRIYDEFQTISRKKQDLSSLENLKKISLKFNQQCNTKAYEISYYGYRDFIKNKIAEVEEETKIDAPLSFPTCKLNNQEWYNDNLSYYGSNGIKLITNQEDWNKLSPSTPCCCYIDFNEGNKEKGILYNAKAVSILMSDQQLNNSDFRIATANDWNKLFENAKKNGSTEKLYNCDGRNMNGFNLRAGGYFDQETWYTPEMGYSGYWVGKDIVYTIDCNSKGELMNDEATDEALKERMEYSAFMVRLIKK